MLCNRCVYLNLTFPIITADSSAMGMGMWKNDAKGKAKATATDSDESTPTNHSGSVAGSGVSLGCMFSALAISIRQIDCVWVYGMHSNPHKNVYSSSGSFGDTWYIVHPRMKLFYQD